MLRNLPTRQIVGNLLSNAVEYTKRGTVALVMDHALDEQTGQPVVSSTLADTSIGVIREAIDHAFAAYMRARITPSYCKACAKTSGTLVRRPRH